MKTSSKKISVFAVIALLLAALIGSLIFAISKTEASKALAADGDGSLPSLVVTMPKNKMGSTSYYCTSDKDKKLSFTFALSKEPSGTIEVVYWAKDDTAVSEAGDYYLICEENESNTDKTARSKVTHSRRIITLDASNYTGVIVSYYVNKSDFAINQSSTTYYNTFDIYYEVYDGLAENVSSKFTIAQYPTRTLKADSSNTLSAYSKSYQQQVGFGKSDRDDGWETKKGDYLGDSSDMHDCYDLVCGGKIGYLYVGAFLSWFNATSWCSCESDFYLYIGDSRQLCHEQIGDVYEEDYYNGSDADEEHMDFDENIPSGTSYFKIGKHTYYKCRQDEGHRYTWVWHAQCYYYRWGDLQLLATFRDPDAPVVIGKYIDTSTTFKDGKIRLAIRFSEPVYNAQNTSIYGYMNNGALGSSSGISFDYVGGVNTNTLTYEAAVDKDLANTEVVLTSVKLDTFDNARLITDFGKNEDGDHNKCQMKAFDSKKDIVYCELDLRKPVIDSGSCSSSNSSAKSRTVNVALSNISQGTLYYCWSQAEPGKFAHGDIKSYTNAIKNNDIGAGMMKVDEGNNTNVAISSPEGYNGAYTLYVCVQSEANKKTSTYFGRDKSSSDKTYGGGYYFDNTAPDLFVKVVGTKKDEKEFQISSKDSYNKGASEETEVSAGLGTLGIYAYDIKTGVIQNTIIWKYSSSSEDYVDNFSYIGKTHEYIKVITLNGRYIENAKVALRAVEYKPDGASETVKELWLYKLGSDKDKTDDDTPLAKVTTLAGQYGKYAVKFYALDSAGNEVSEESFTQYRYDMREMFKMTGWADKANVFGEATASGVQENVYTKDVKLTFTYKDIAVGITDTLCISKLYYGSSEEPVYDVDDAKKSNPSLLSGYISFENPSKDTLNIVPKKLGYYGIECAVNSEGSYLFGQDKDTIETKYEYYITDGGMSASTGNTNYEDTANYVKSNGNLVLNNLVYMLGVNLYYYMNENNAVMTMAYNNCSSAAAFSGISKAEEYIKYMEYQDMSILHIEDNDKGRNIATGLNGGGDIQYAKADGVNANAGVNQTWIRYKRANWKTSSGTEGWAYYFYDTGLHNDISLNKIKDTPLENAVNSVTTYLKNQVSRVNLVGDSYTDSKSDAPKLAPGQIHFDVERASQTKTGTSFSSSVDFSGDNNIYQNTIVDSRTQSNYVLATNLELSVSSNTKLYYRTNTTDRFKPMEAEDGMLLKKAIPGVGSGTYEILELDGAGVRVFTVYVDVSAPVLRVSYVSAVQETENELYLSENMGGKVYSARSFSVISMAGEADTGAYVAICNQKTEIIDIFFTNEAGSINYNLANDIYYILVGDRSGNVYSITVQVNSEPLKFEVIQEGNDYIKMVCNRDENQIYLYTVTCDGVDVATKADYAPTVRYKASGYYVFYVQDIYGFNNSTEGGVGSSYQFDRDRPTVTWSYSTSSGYTKYTEGTTTVMNMVKTLEGYSISSSKSLRFSFTEDYSYEFDGVRNTEWSYNNVNHSVTINTDASYWTVKVSYTAYPDTYSIYKVYMDTSAPTITASYKVTSYAFDGEEEMAKVAKTSKLGDIYTPGVVTYSKNSQYTNNISEGDYVVSDLIKLSVTDSSGVRSVVIYFDGEEFKSFELKTGQSFSPITLNKRGEYKIVSTDIFGNESTLSFHNDVKESALIGIDDSGDKASDVVENYGHDNVTVCMKEDGKLMLLVKFEGKSYYIFLSLEEGKVALAHYMAKSTKSDDIGGDVIKFGVEVQTHEVQVMSDGGQYTTRDVIDAFFDSSLKSSVKGVWQSFLIDGNTAARYEVNDFTSQKDLNGVVLYVMFDGEGNFYFKVGAINGIRVTVEASVFFESTRKPDYAKVILSDELSDVVFRDVQDGIVPEAENDGVVRTNCTFNIESIPEEVTSVEVAYSELKDFSDIFVWYAKSQGIVTPSFTIEVLREGIYVSETINGTTANGFYRIRVTNVFGNVKEYIVNRSDELVVLAIATYDDLTESAFDKSYDGIVKANRSIRIENYAEESVMTLKNNATSETDVVVGEKKPGYYSFVLDAEGSFTLTVKDTFGNERVMNLDIKKTNLVYDEALLSGYNEKALRKAEGYTSNKLSISEDAMASLDIRYVSVSKDGKTEVLYNGLTQRSVSYDSKAFVEAVGKNGDGVYTVTFRDAYGSIAQKVVHFSSKPTITVTRQIRSSTTAEEIDLAEAQSSGVWSNSIIRFTTTAEVYKFVVDGTETICPKEFAFSTASGNGSFDYTTTFVDEYGYQYAIPVHLLRQDMEIVLGDGIQTQTIGDIITTRNYLSITYSRDASCVYRLNGGASVSYDEGAMLYKDGTYTFMVIDRAGNFASLIIKKDTICEFSFVVERTEKTLLNGDVVNEGDVALKVLNGDNVEIKEIYYNSTRLSDYKESVFSDTGRWDIKLGDAIGNSTMFSFYIIKHSLASFEFTTPNNYVITSFLYDIGDGNQIDYRQMVAQTGERSSFVATENGTYTAIMASKIYNNSVEFSFQIDNTPPHVELDGCVEGETTMNTIKLKGCSLGDTIYVYKDGVLSKTVKLESSADKTPEISEGGKYRIVVVNQAGVSTELTFVRTHITNTAGSVLIIIACVLAAVGLIIGIALRNRQKIDD